MIDSEGVSVRAAVPRWFGGLFVGRVGTVARGCRRSHGDQVDKVDRCASEPGTVGEQGQVYFDFGYHGVSGSWNPVTEHHAHHGKNCGPYRVVLPWGITFV